MVIWERVEKAGRPSRATLSYERITKAAVDLADTEGLDAVSMRRVAAKLGSGTMSLYRYVENRDELIELMADAVYGEGVAPEPTGDWRQDLADWARRSRQVALNHPWLAGHATLRGSFGPNMLAMMESTLALLDGHGMSGARMWDLWATVQSFVQGHVLEELAVLREEQRTGLDEEAWRDRLVPHLVRMLDTGRYPHLTKVFADKRRHADGSDDFERRLKLLIDGLRHVSQ
jgi:AcrR family transcriptional regulator